jgi:hypothetical protein
LLLLLLSSLCSKEERCVVEDVDNEIFLVDNM